MKRVLVFLFFLQAAAAQPEVVAIRGARVIDGTGAPAQPATVLIRGSRIEAVGADVAIPPGARIVEAAGRDAHPGTIRSPYAPGCFGGDRRGRGLGQEPESVSGLRSHFCG